MPPMQLGVLNVTLPRGSSGGGHLRERGGARGHKGGWVWAVGSSTEVMLSVGMLLE